MIIVNLMGGLGNQMFQYASAKHLAMLHDTVLRTDSFNFRKMTLNKEHVFQLNCFRITAPQAREEEIRKLKPAESRLGRIRRAVSRLFGPHGSRTKGGLVYLEPDGSEFKPGFFELGPDRYLIGYFNSYKYFSPIRDLLIEEFTPRDISEKGRELTKLIESTNSVGVHFRRGDYVTDPDVHKSVAGVITEEYYRNATECMLSRIEDPHFFIFSNDMPWVKEHFKVTARVTYVDINPPNKGYEDLWMMSRCRHNIVAGGSTFSWWAAWLNQNPGKIVLRTERISNDPWYNHPEDYFPPEWGVAAS
ncbi:MAG TPA: alpha-1,2-fucosyltransferase [Syntrophales bacterium]|nr:alpha-1,2-fucosyltransferase [Syntrophales bacterium]